jgi:hypothetical protein
MMVMISIVTMIITYVFAMMPMKHEFKEVKNTDSEENTYSHSSWVYFSSLYQFWDKP